MRKSLLAVFLLSIICISDVKAQSPSIFGPSIRDYCAGQTAKFYCNVPPGNYSWQVSQDNGTTWTTITSGGQYTVVSSPYFGLTFDADYTMQHNCYRVIDNSDPTVYSYGDTLSVNLTTHTPIFIDPVTAVYPGTTVIYNITGSLTNDSLWWHYDGGALFNPTISLGDSTVLVYFSPNAVSDNLVIRDYNGCGSTEPAIPITIMPLRTTLAGVAGGAAVCSNSSVFHGAATVFPDVSGSPIVAISPSGASPVSGSIQSCVAVDASVQSFGGIPYVPRHYNMEPSSGGTTSTATVTLYFTQADFDAYNAARGGNPALPMNSSDATGIANLHITQFHGTGTTPDTYVGGSGDIDPDDNNIIWNATASRWEVTFDITGFSGFFVSGSSIVPLPLTLTDFSGKETKAGNQLHWTTSIEENTAYFQVEREAAADAGFVSVGKVSAAGNSNQTVQYDYTDVVKGDALYRLKMVDIDGKFTYSRIVALGLAADALTLRVLPNPAHQPLSLIVGSPAAASTVLTVTDMSGKKILEKHVSLQKGTNSIDPGILAKLPQGIYLIGVATDKQQQTIKFVRE